MAINQPQVVSAPQGSSVTEMMRSLQSTISDMLKLNAQRDQLNEMKRETNFKGTMQLISDFAAGYPGGYVALSQDMPSLFTNAWTMLGASPTMANKMLATMQGGLMSASQLQAHSFAQAMQQDSVGTMKAIAAEAQNPNSGSFLSWTDNFNQMFGETAGVLPGQQGGPQRTQQPGAASAPQAQGQPQQQPAPAAPSAETPPPINAQPLSGAWWGQLANRYSWNRDHKLNPMENILQGLSDTVLKAATGFTGQQIKEASNALADKIKNWYQNKVGQIESTSSVGTPPPAQQPPAQGQPPAAQSTYHAPGSQEFQQQFQDAVNAINEGKTPTMPKAPTRPELYQPPVTTIQGVNEAVQAIKTNDPKLAAQSLPTVPMTTLDVNGNIHYVGSQDMPESPGSVGNAARDRVLQKAWDALRTSLNTLPADQGKVLDKAAPVLRAATTIIGQEVKQKLSPKTPEERATALDIVKFFNSRAGQQMLQTPGERLQSRQLDLAEGQSKVEMMMKYFTLKLGQSTDQGIPLTQQMAVADKMLAPYTKDQKFWTDSTYRAKVFNRNHSAEYAYAVYQKALGGIFGVKLINSPEFMKNFLIFHWDQYNTPGLPPLMSQGTTRTPESSLSSAGQSYLKNLTGQ